MQWNIFDPSQNSIELVEHIKGAEISNKIGDLTTFDILAQTSYRNINLAFGTQASVNLDINFNEISRAEFDSDGKIIKTADLFFLGGGKNVNESRNKYSLYFELDSSFLPNFDYRFSGRFENLRIFHPLTLSCLLNTNFLKIFLSEFHLVLLFYYAFYGTNVFK